MIRTNQFSRGYLACVPDQVSRSHKLKKSTTLNLHLTGADLALNPRQVQKMSLRPYQSRIVREVFGQNSIVLLPTGAGKTHIAAEVMRQSLVEPGRGKGLFLVPTVLLVEQQVGGLLVILSLKKVEYDLLEVKREISRLCRVSSRVQFVIL